MLLQEIIFEIVLMQEDRVRHVALCNANPKNCDLLIPAVVQSETQSDPEGSRPAVVFPAG